MREFETGRTRRPRNTDGVSVTLNEAFAAEGYDGITVVVKNNGRRFCYEACKNFLNAAIEAEDGLVETIVAELSEAEGTRQGKKNVGALTEVVIEPAGDHWFKMSRAVLEKIKGTHSLRLKIRMYYAWGFINDGDFVEASVEAMLDDLAVAVDAELQTDPFHTVKSVKHSGATQRMQH